MRTGWTITSILLALLFLMFFTGAVQLPLLDELGPGPGFFPLALAVLGLLLSILLFFRIRAQVLEFSALADDTALLPKGKFRVASVVGLIAIAALVLEPVGYTLTTLVLLPVALIILGARSPITIILVSGALSVGVFHIFYHWLGVPLPVGLFGI